MNKYGVTVREVCSQVRRVTIVVEASNSTEAEEAIEHQLREGTLEWNRATDHESTDWVDYTVDGNARRGDDWSEIDPRHYRRP
jgi:hypothetical protein